MTVTLAHHLRRPALGVALAIAAAAGGCANDSGMANMFTTGSINEQAAVAKPTVDPVCVSLASQIETLRKEGAVERLEKASDGKSANVNVQRTALAKQAQLNKANADFIAKCGPSLPKATVAAAAVPAATASPATAAKAASTAVKASAPSGVTVAAPAAAVVAAPAQ